nr:TonB-dependent receptor [uncultured Roseateles sp.]
MFKRNKLSSAAALLFSGMLPALLPAMAQSTEKVEKIESVVVTGSRIIRPNLTSNSPTVAVTTETMGNLGIENFADMATQMPQFAPAFGASRTQSTFSGVESSGLNNTNLRNLGTFRSLVLVNGRRVPGGTSTDMSVDFNTMPTANIDRIEVITGGASAIYGADAVAGVVNIITKKNFEGVQLDVSYGAASKGDNKNPSASIMMGGKFGDAGRALVTLQLDKQGQVSCADREICNDDVDYRDPKNLIKGPGARSGVPIGGRFFPGDGNSYSMRNGSIVDASGKLMPFSREVDGYNRNAQRDLAIPTKRVMMATDIEYKLNDKVSVFSEINYSQATIDSKFEGQPFQGDGTDSYGDLAISIPRNNPFLPAALRAAMPADSDEVQWWQRFGEANIPGGNRGAKSERSTFRAVTGLKGELDSLGGFGKDWRWELSHVYGRTRVNLGTEGSLGRAEMYNGLRVVETAPGSGVYQCADSTARALGCVPINPFKPLTKAMSDYISKSTNSTGEGVLNDSVASLSGALFELPAGALRAAVGAERRSFSGYLDHDSLINSGLVTGNQVNDTAKSKTTTNELFAEILVPVLADKPFINSLNLESAFRNSKSSGKSYDTWKFGGDWEPTNGLRFRAMKARAVRTPVPSELGGGGQTFGQIGDPCTVDNIGPAGGIRAKNCLADGVPVGYKPDLSVEQSVSGQTGGNANLKPERSTSLTYGLVFQPSMLKGFSIAIDRFEIDLTDAIASVDRQTAVDLCYDTAVRALCNQVTRGSHPLVAGNYALRAVDENLQNIATQVVKGVDLDVRYAFKTGRFGDFDLNGTMTIYDKATFLQSAGQPIQNLLGYAGGSTITQGYIRVTANGNIGWKQGAFKANWNVRYIGSAEMGSDTAGKGFPKLPAHMYHNVRGSYQLNKSTELYAGVTNLFNKQPPLFAANSSGTQALDTIPGYYDVFGRSYFMGASMKF